MSSTLPKEQQSAYQRWEMASFGDERPSAQAATVGNVNLAALREEARLEGYDAGLEAGHAAGYAAGQAAGLANAAVELAHLQQVAVTFGAEIALANTLVGEDTLDLALDLAKAILKTSLKIRPELVLPVVADAIRYLPSLQQPALLFLNPADATLVRDAMQEELDKSGWRIAEDAHMERGGCRVETATNQIDASIAIRWQRIAAALGKEIDWLE
ncbi:flagellar assembly protein FliH [soil metagenome]